MKRVLFFLIFLPLFAVSQNWDIQLPDYDVVLTRDADVQQTRDWGHVMLRASEYYAQQGVRGRNVHIFILDTGIETAHPDLAANIDVQYARDFTNSASGFQDRHGHGTHCAGIAAAIDNSVGIIGIAPSARLVPVKVLNDSGSGSFSWVAAGIRYVADLTIPNSRGKIISMSLGGSAGSVELENAINYAISKGCIVIAAAGNSGCPGNNSNTIGFPGRYPQVLTIASVSENGQASSFSSCGEQIDVAAPGQNILSTHLNGQYARLSGTSMATPQVAGLMALFIEKFGNVGQTAFEKWLRDFANGSEWNNRTGKGIPIATNYTTPPSNDPTPPNPPNPPNPPTPPVPPPAFQTRTVITYPQAAPAIMYKTMSGGAFKTAQIVALTVEFSTDQHISLAHQFMSDEVNSYFKNRAFILPDNNDSPDFAVAVADHFFRMHLANTRKTAGRFVTATAIGDGVVAYFHKDHPYRVQTNILFKGEKAQQRKISRTVSTFEFVK